MTTMKRWGDTLFLRLFLLMWAALVASHLLAFGTVRLWQAPPAHEAPHSGLREPPRDGPPGAAPSLPVLPSLPPMGAPPDRGRHDGAPPPHPDDAPPEPRGGLPAGALWLDYAVRFVAIGIAAWFGARWLSAPMRRLSQASEALGAALVQRRPAPVLDDTRGTHEVRQTAQVFNAMAQRLRSQFDAQSLLMATISHDLRTPLARLRLRLETMDAPDRQQTQRCIADVREMDALIGDLLGMLRDGHARAEPERVDAGAMVQALVDDLAEQGQPVTLADTPAPGSAIVLARPAALRRIVGNLVGNALRYGDAAELTLACAAGELRIDVADRGPGIAPDRLDAVFEPYVRLDPSRPHSVGLGLTIARDLAQREGGRLALANRPGGGLLATLTLPLA